MSKPFTVDDVNRIFPLPAWLPDNGQERIVKDLNDHIEQYMKEQTRWIPTSERLPNKEDADENGRIEFWFQPLRCSVSRKYYAYLGEDTHWRRIVKP